MNIDELPDATDSEELDRFAIDAILRELSPGELRELYHKALYIVAMSGRAVFTASPGDPPSIGLN